MPGSRDMESRILIHRQYGRAGAMIRQNIINSLTCPRYWRCDYHFRGKPAFLFAVKIGYLAHYEANVIF